MTCCNGYGDMLSWLRYYVVMVTVVCCHGYGDLPTYVTYVEFHQDLTGPSDHPTTPERSCSSIISPAQQIIGVRWSVTPDWWHIREG